MITALVHLRDGDIAALGTTLSALVAGVAQGVVADAVVIAPRSSPELEFFADAAGATLVIAEQRPFQAGVQAARRDWLLCLDAGDVPLEDWPRALDRFRAREAQRGGKGSAIGRLGRAPQRLLDRLVLPFARFAPGPRAGDLAHASHFGAGARARIAPLPVRLARKDAPD